MIMKTLLKILILGLGIFVFAQDPVQVVITTTGASSFTVPPGVNSITVECWGGGGRGATRTTNGVGGGGGGGAYSRKVHSVIPGNSYNFFVGAGSNSTTSGGDTWFINNTTQLAKGGNSANDNSDLGVTGGSSALSIGDIVFSGGNGRNGNTSGTNYGGGGGSSAGIAQNGVNATNQTGAVAPTGGANGGNGRLDSQGNGSNASNPGGGGGGALRTSSETRTGGRGGNGQLRITYIIQTNHTIYFEDFNSNDGGWSSSNAPGKVGSWVRDSAPLIGQGSYFRTNSYNNFTRNTGIYLTSPIINLSGFRDIHFSLDFRHELPDANDGFQVQYSINGGAWTILNSTTVYDFWHPNNSISSLGGTSGWTSTNTENANSPSKFNEATCALAALDNQSNVRFRIYFADNNDTNLGGGVAIDNIIIRGNPIVSFSDPVSAPAGINQNLKLWLSSTNPGSTLTDGDDLSTWNDLAFDNHAKSFGIFRPKYRNSSDRNINFNSVIDFNRNSSNYLIGKGGFWTSEYFIVVQANSTVDKTTSNSMVPLSGKYAKDAMGQDGTGLGLGRISSRFNSNALVSHLISTYSQTGSPGPNSYGRSFAPTSVSTLDQSVMVINVKSNTSVTPAISEIYINGKRVDNHTGTVGTTGTGTPLLFSEFRNLVYNIGAGQFTLNGFSLNSYLDGKISEVFSYSQPNSLLNQQKIYSYLAIKNGVSLKNPSSSLAYNSNQADWNYIDSNNQVIWDVTANAGFNFDVAGIGRDDNGSLIQKQSKSSNPNTVVSIGIGDVMPVNSENTHNFSGDRQFLVWGSNNQNMNNSGTPINVDLGPITITTVTEVVNRKWKIVETGGDVGITKVSVPISAFTSGLPVLGPTDAYVMVVANDANFTTGIETVFMQTEGTNQTCRYDFDGTKFFTFGVAHRTVESNHITLDGMDDFVKIDKVNELNSTFSIMGWVQLNGNNNLGNTRTVYSKSNGTDGYEMYVNNDGRVRFEWKISGTAYGLTSSVPLPNLQWHHLTVNYDGNNLVLYIDGVQDVSTSITTPPSNSDTFFAIGARYIDKNNITNLFKGSIDELRFFNKSLTIDEIRFIMNQEIEEHGAGITGTIIPSTITKNEINTLNWTDLQAYYSMNSYIGTHLDDDSVHINRGSLVIPDKVSINPQTAPMPYETIGNGQWENPVVWKDHVTCELPHSLSIIDNTTPIDWNIVKTNHNIVSQGNKTLLGLFVQSNQITVHNNSKIEISHYLKLDGKIDLENRSQLVQTYQSDLDPISSGFIERDQQGQGNRFNYNYWSSPVSSIHPTTINHGGSVNSFMRDGTNPNNPLPFQWTGGLNGSSTTPITLSSYWIFKFINTTPLYANWTQVGPNGNIVAAQGYTMKGHAGIGAPQQNYVFVGKPNNGTITTFVGPNNLNLSGNPYPSALDAEKFIDDNLGVMTGAIYMWEHYSTNNTHNLAGYQGGYATLTKVGATPPIAPPGISGMGTSSKIAGRYIPVGQGFFVYGNATGGTIVYNNSQRAFIKENNGLSNTMFKPGKDKGSTTPSEHFTNNSDDVPTNVSNSPKIRIGFKTNTGHHRQVLIGFMGDAADDGFNPGFDGRHIDNQPSDMYFIMNNSNTLLNIQGVGNFDVTKTYPIGVKAGVNGNFQFTLDAVENLSDDIPIFIYDNETGIYHNIRNGNVTLNLTSGNHHTRFQLRFQDQTLSTSPQDLIHGIQVLYATNDKSIHIKNDQLFDLKELKVYNMLGQEVFVKSKFDISSHEIIPINQLNSGNYLIKLNTEHGNLTSKFIVP